MKCNFADTLLQCYFDGELSGRAAAGFERHVQHCAHCATELVDLDLLRGSLQLTQLYKPAPASLRRTINAYIHPVAPSKAVSQPLLWHWLAAAAAMLLIGIVLWKASPGLRSDDYQAELAGEIVEAHVRSLQPGQMTGIASNDERVVKGWLDSRTSFGVSVRDFANRGFALHGGRLDTIEGRDVAVVVYERNGRPINVFIWPTRERDNPPRTGTRQGFKWLDWRKGRLEFCAVSEADTADLEQLQELISASAQVSREYH